MRAAVLVVMLGVVRARVAREGGEVGEEMEGECEDSKLQAMQADFNKCAVELGYKFETERKEKDEEVNI